MHFLVTNGSPEVINQPKTQHYILPPIFILLTTLKILADLHYSSGLLGHILRVCYGLTDMALMKYCIELKAVEKRSYEKNSVRLQTSSSFLLGIGKI